MELKQARRRRDQWRKEALGWRAQEREGVWRSARQKGKKRREKKERMTGGPHSVVVSIENET